MKNDKLKVGDVVWYEDYCVHFCTVKKNNKDHIIVKEDIYNHPSLEYCIKKDNVQKVPKVHVKISNTKISEIEKHWNGCTSSFVSFKKTKQVWRLCYMKYTYIAIVFYSPNKKRKLFCISPPEDIFIEQKFIAIYL